MNTETPLFHRHPDDTLMTLSVYEEKKSVSTFRHTGILIEYADGTTYRADYRRQGRLPTVRPVTDRGQFDATLKTIIRVGTVNIDPDELRALLNQMASTTYNPLTFNCRDYCVDVIDRIRRKLPLQTVMTPGADRARNHILYYVSAMDRSVVACVLFVLVAVVVLLGMWIHSVSKARKMMA